MRNEEKAAESVALKRAHVQVGRGAGFPVLCFAEGVWRFGHGRAQAVLLGGPVLSCLNISRHIPYLTLSCPVSS